MLDANATKLLRQRVGISPGTTVKKPARSHPRRSLHDADCGTDDALGEHRAGRATVGGMASGAEKAGETVLLLNRDIVEDGAVGVRIAGPVRVETVVSQGCRPVGETMLVTKAEGNMIETLGGRPALEVAREILSALTTHEQDMVENGVYLGIVINEYQEAFDRGDFLIRNVLGADPDTGAVAIGDTVRAGQTVQFHIRDAQVADEDLRIMMPAPRRTRPCRQAASVFSCNGRGTRMFDMPNHDVRGVLEMVPETPLAGFFAAGELGPVGGKNFIHGQTASILLFSPAKGSRLGMRDEGSRHE